MKMTNMQRETLENEKMEVANMKHDNSEKGQF